MADPLIDRLRRHLGDPESLTDRLRAHLDQGKTRLPSSVAKPSASGAIAQFVDQHFKHFNAGTLQRAAEAYVAHLVKGGKMFLAMAGAFSTGEMGRVLAPMIRAGKIHGLSVTAANLEEDLYLLVGGNDYKALPDYHELTPEKDQALGESGHPRVTDTTISEDSAMKPVTEAIRAVWNRLMQKNERAFPHEVLFEVIRSGVLESSYQRDPKDSWLVAASEMDLPIWTPGFEDSTTGNVFAGDCFEAKYDPTMIKNGVEAMLELIRWYLETSKTSPMGFAELGGGIAADYALCVVPLIVADLRMDVDRWSYYVSLTGADESFGGFSGAFPTEKRSWIKLDSNSTDFLVKGDFSINFAILSAYVLGL